MASLTSSGRGRRSEIRNIKLRSNMEMISFSLLTKQLFTHYPQKNNNITRHMPSETSQRSEKGKFLCYIVNLKGYLQMLLLFRSLDITIRNGFFLVRKLPSICAIYISFLNWIHFILCSKIAHYECITSREKKESGVTVTTKC